MKRIRSLADLRPGDIMFGPISGAVGLGVGLGQVLLGEGFRVGSLSVRHVAIVTQAARQVPPFELPQTPRAEWVEGRRYGPPRIVQAMPSGAEEVDLTKGHWTERHAYVRLPEDYSGQAGDAASIARLMVAEGVGYSFTSYLALAAWRFGIRTERQGRWINRRIPGALSYRLPGALSNVVMIPRRAICSVLVDQAWTLAGKKVMENTRPQVVTPGALAGELLSREGAIWAVPFGDGYEDWPARSWEV